VKTSGNCRCIVTPGLHWRIARQRRSAGRCLFIPPHVRLYISRTHLTPNVAPSLPLTGSTSPDSSLPNFVKSLITTCPTQRHVATHPHTHTHRHVHPVPSHPQPRHQVKATNQICGPTPCRSAVWTSDGKFLSQCGNP